MKFLIYLPIAVLLLGGCAEGGSTQADIDESAKQLREAAKDSPDYGPDPAVVQMGAGGGGEVGIPKKGIK